MGFRLFKGLIPWMGIFLLLLAGKAAYAQEDAQTFILPEQAEGIMLGRFLSFWPDLTATKTLDQVQEAAQNKEFKRVKTDAASFGYQNVGASYWWRLKLTNPGSGLRKILLLVRYAQTDEVLVYHRTLDGSWIQKAIGDQYPLEKGQIPSRYPLLTLNLEPGEHEFFLRLKPTGSMQLPLVLWDQEAYSRHSLHENLLLGVFFGCCGVMLFYNLFVSLRFQSSAYGLYVLYIAAYLIFSLSFHGLTKLYLMPETGSAWFLRQGYLLTVDLVSITSLLFTLIFLKVDEYLPRIARMIQGFCLFFGFNSVLHLLEVGFAVRVSVFGNLLMSFVLLAIGFAQLRHVRYARYFILAWSTLLVGNMLLILSNAAVIPPSDLSYWGQSIGAGLELIFLSLALGDRMATLNNEHVTAIREQQFLQESLAQTERARSVLQEELKEEAQFKVDVVSDLAHRINNPLNHVSISLSALDVDVRKIEADLRALFSGSEDDPEVQDILGNFSKKFLESHRFTSIAGESTQKVASFVKQIRAISGVDGFAAQRENLPPILQSSLQRLYENVGPEWKTKIRWSSQLPSDSFLMGNHFALLLSLELVFRHWCENISEGFAVDLYWSQDVQAELICFEVRLQEEWKDPTPVPEKAALQLRYLLKPYNLNPKWTPHGLRLECRRTVIDPTVYPKAS